MDGASPKRSSGEEVAQMTRSMSAGAVRAMSRAFLAASIPRVRRVSSISASIVPPSSSSSVVAVMTERVPSCTRTRRSWMPVRDRIHSSEVSWTDSRSTLVMRVWGEALPIPMGRTDIPPPDAERDVVVVVLLAAVVLVMVVIRDDEAELLLLFGLLIEKAETPALRMAMDARKNFIFLFWRGFDVLFIVREAGGDEYIYPEKRFFFLLRRRNLCM
mmetsp:Transcript_12114/g.26061  ORF Transcript_12114/g.26061 Transcript_12114/m.26061 type:complete len:216 (-) Transcript_12114:436-1083(-)